MPIIQRPQSGGSGTVDGIRIGTGNSATATAIIGETTAGMGRDIAALGQEYINKAQRSLSTAVYDLNMQKATDEFNTLAQERMAQTTDKHGNPNFGTLAQDIEDIGNKVMAKRMMTIFDLNAQGQFAKDFRNFSSSQAIKASGVARKQELDYSRAQVNATMTATINKGIAGDMADIPNTMQGMKKSLDSYLAAGAISKIEYDNFINQTQSTVYKAKWSEMIKSNPELVKDIMEGNKSPDLVGLQTTGLNEVDNIKMLAQADAQIEDNAREASRVQRDFDKQQKQLQSDNYAQWQNAVLGSNQGLSDLTSLYNNDGITIQQFVAGQQWLEGRNARKDKQLDTQLAISDAMANNKPLTSFTDKDIDSHYATQISLLQQGGADLTMEQKAGIASKYTAPITSLNKEVAYAVKHGDLDSAVEAMNASEYLDNVNSIVMSKLDKDSASIIANASVLVEDTGIPPQKAIEISRENFATLTPEIRQELSNEFNSEEDFNIESMAGKANMILGEGFFGFGTEDLAPGVATQLKRLYKEAYVSTRGDQAATDKLVKKWTANTLGTTSVGGGERIMMLAPEKVFPHATSDELNEILREDFPEVPKDKEIVIEQDRASRDIPGMITYAASYVNDEGDVVQLDRWSLTNEYIIERRGAQKEAIPSVEELMKGRKKTAIQEDIKKELIRKQNFLGSAPFDEGL